MKRQRDQSSCTMVTAPDITTWFLIHVTLYHLLRIISRIGQQTRFRGAEEPLVDKLISVRNITSVCTRWRFVHKYRVVIVRLFGHSPIHQSHQSPVFEIMHSFVSNHWNIMFVDKLSEQRVKYSLSAFPLFLKLQKRRFRELQFIGGQLRLYVLNVVLVFGVDEVIGILVLFFLFHCVHHFGSADGDGYIHLEWTDWNQFRAS
mmetsp:Transcript_10024/g.16118  ORF Transcript_10024/g.16118 Transcript_10024/m.16118 type:complete len:203 (+) Transcript_10024:405-1013(+)